MTAPADAPTPVEIGRANLADIKVKWEDGHESVYPAKYLRLNCPCAGCVDEVTGKRRLAAAGVPEDVKPLGIQLVGRYAIHIQWSDSHRTGIYAFDLLRKLCPCCRSSV
ncbi:MAG: DUF971 domain-containing protein [Candidatus Omnitrophica bacterium]|nr:DUF971 domain-containing protein [Candidatus Omnitrophota bacterium]